MAPFQSRGGFGGSSQLVCLHADVWGADSLDSKDMHAVLPTASKDSNDYLFCDTGAPSNTVTEWQFDFVAIGAGQNCQAAF